VHFYQFEKLHLIIVYPIIQFLPPYRYSDTHREILLISLLTQFSPGVFGIEKLEQLEDKLLIDHFLPDGGLEVRGFKES
jgi:hypothetical protein